MAPKDRTSEFHSTLASIKSRSALSASSSSAGKGKAEAKQPLIPKENGRSTPKGTGSKSEFGRMAGGIAKDINSTTLKLQKLAQCRFHTRHPRIPVCNTDEIVAKRKTLFDDRPIEISELTYIIRQDIASLNTQIASLQSYIRAQKQPATTGKGQVEEHNSNVVMMLQSRLADMGMGFKDVLELRTQNMKASKDRSEQFMHTTANSTLQPANSMFSRLVIWYLR
jgi:syntaxin 5